MNVNILLNLKDLEDEMIQLDIPNDIKRIILMYSGHVVGFGSKGLTWVIYF